MRASGRSAVIVLGLLVLWAVVFSIPGGSQVTVPAIILWTVAGTAMLYGLHRSLVYCEERGWIYYRNGRGGDGRLGAAAEWLNIYDPSRRHLQDTVREREWKRDDDEDGDRPRP